jgi:hypothetical protein
MTLKEILHFFDRMSDRDSQVVKDTVETLDAVMVEVQERLYHVQEQDAAGDGPLIARTGTAQSGRSVDEASISTGKETADSGALVFTRPASISTDATSVHARPRSVKFQMPKPQRAIIWSEENTRFSSHTDPKSRLEFIPGSTKDIVRGGTLELFLQKLHEAAELNTEGLSR